MVVEENRPPILIRILGVDMLRTVVLLTSGAELALSSDRGSRNPVDVAEEEISISIGQLKRVPLEWGEEVRFTSYQGKEPVGSFSVELLSVVGTLESSHWDRLLVRNAWENERFCQAIDIARTEGKLWRLPRLVHLPRLRAALRGPLYHPLCSLPPLPRSDF
jgi:hypothetical protein